MISSLVKRSFQALPAVDVLQLYANQTEKKKKTRKQRAGTQHKLFCFKVSAQRELAILLYTCFDAM